MFVVALQCYKYYKVSAGELRLKYTSKGCEFTEEERISVSYIYVETGIAEQVNLNFQRKDAHILLSKHYSPKVTAVYAFNADIGYTVKYYNQTVIIAIVCSVVVLILFACVIVYIVYLHYKQKRIDKLKVEYLYISLRGESTSQEETEDKVMDYRVDIDGEYEHVPSKDMDYPSLNSEKSTSVLG